MKLSALTFLRKYAARCSFQPLQSALNRQMQPGGSWGSVTSFPGAAGLGHGVLTDIHSCNRRPAFVMLMAAKSCARNRAPPHSRHNATQKPQYACMQLSAPRECWLKRSLKAACGPATARCGRSSSCRIPHFGTRVLDSTIFHSVLMWQPQICSAHLAFLLRQARRCEHAR